MRRHLFHFAMVGVAVLSVMEIIVGFLIYRRVDHDDINDDVVALSAHEVGIDSLISQKIVSASYQCHIPNYNYECKNLEEITSLLNTVKDAEFQITNEPKGALSMIEMILVKTENGSYSFGVMGSAFVVNINGERNYYNCSARNDFILKLLEIQGR